jgi:hypothetical protein
MANAFILMLRGVIFQKLCATSRDIIQFIPFVHTFYAFESPLFNNHHNHEGDVIVIPSTMGIYQGDPLGGALFTLAHFSTLRSITNCFPSCVFPSIIDSIHIINPPSIISSTYEHFRSKFYM